MANELTLSASLAYRKGNDSLAFAPAQKQITVTGTRRITNTQVLSTTAEALVISEISSAVYAWFHNLDTTNNIFISLDSGATNKICTLKPGEFAVFRPATTTLFAGAVASTPLLAWGIIED